MSARPKSSPRPSGPERRQHPRAEADWGIEIALDDGPQRGRLRDVSRAGVCFFMERPIPLMTALRLRLELPGGAGTVQGTGAVVRCERISPGLEHYEVAMFLHELSEGDRRAIDDYVRSLVA